MSGQNHDKPKPIRVTGDGEFTPQQRAEFLESLREGRQDNSGGFYVPPEEESSGVARVGDPSEQRSTEGAHDIHGDDPITGEESKLAIRAIRLGVNPSHLLVPSTTLENAIVNEIGDVVPPDGIDEDTGEVGDDLFSYYESDYRDLVGQETEDVEDLDDEEGVVRQSGDKTFIPGDDYIGLVGAKEVDGDVLPDDDDPLNGPMAA